MRSGPLYTIRTKRGPEGPRKIRHITVLSGVLSSPCSVLHASFRPMRVPNLLFIHYPPPPTCFKYILCVGLCAPLRHPGHRPPHSTRGACCDIGRIGFVSRCRRNSRAMVCLVTPWFLSYSGLSPCSLPYGLSRVPY